MRRAVEPSPRERPQTPLCGGTVYHLGNQLSRHMVVCYLYCDEESVRREVCVCEWGGWRGGVIVQLKCACE